MNEKNNKNNEYKINKYKLKFLYSLLEKNQHNTEIYLKKYSQYINLNNCQIGGTNIKINSQTELENLLFNITKLFNAIFGEKISNDIMGEFKSKVKLNNLKYPEDLNLRTLIINIFKAIYSNQDTNELDEKLLNQINGIIDKIKPYKPDKPVEQVKHDETDKINKQNELKFNTLFNPIFIQPQNFYYPFNQYDQYNNIPGLNITIVDSSTTEETKETDKKYKKEKKDKTDKKDILVNKYFKKNLKIKDNIVIY